MTHEGESTDVDNNNNEEVDEENVIERTPQASGATQYPDRAFLNAVGDNEPATTGDVAAEVGCSQQTAARRLKRLEDHGDLLSKKIGQAYLWILMPDDEDDE